jgi:hypothetical protein
LLCYRSEGDFDRKALVPYLKCVSCKIRVSTADAGTDQTGRSCPACGRSLEPVGKLAEVLGFRTPNIYDSSVPPRVADISGGRSATEADLDADRWLNEGGSLLPEALAEAVALPSPPRTGS